MSDKDTAQGYVGNDRLLLGIVLAVVTFWLFAQTTLNVAPDMRADLGITENWSNMPSALPLSFPVFSPSYSADWVINSAV